jgi:hypothetical protein
VGNLIVSLGPIEALRQPTLGEARISTDNPEGWEPQGAWAFMRQDRLAMVFCDHDRFRAPWHAALIGAAAGRVDPSFLGDPRGRLRSFTSAGEARAAVEAALRHRRLIA